MYRESSYVAWAEGWLSGADRSRDAAARAAAAAKIDMAALAHKAVDEQAPGPKALAMMEAM